ncbi:MAG: M24 family metallopeptidase [Patescibacteria group bacterium]|nr:M24 family metallopeptidase [Patescibacteria group bacterium]
MGWNKTKINKHIKAAELLNKIKDEAFKYVRKNKNISEYDVQRFIMGKFKMNGLRTDRAPIIAFRQNTSFVHYYPSRHSKKLKLESLILIDIWARFKGKNSPFADITWMGYYGKKIPREVSGIFKIIIKARDGAIRYIEDVLRQGKIPDSYKIDKAARDIIKKSGFGDNFLHTTGHSLGFVSPHGGKRIGPKSKGLLRENVAYTIEPGIYLKNKFGARSEIDFYINSDRKLVITTGLQKNIIRFNN